LERATKDRIVQKFPGEKSAHDLNTVTNVEYGEMDVIFQHWDNWQQCDLSGNR
jgi:hypothetical protein